MNIVRNLGRLLIAPVFIFAGFVKAIDPLGFTYKFTDYFEAFNLDFLSPLALPLAIILSTAELLIGLLLLFKIRMRETAWALLVFMVFFTILTFIIALTNPVTDCGCFGDALVITNWQTFFKNLIFLAPTIIVFQQRNEFYKGFNPLVQWLIVGGLYLAAIILSIQSYRTLPMIDFRPYKIGTHIPSAMKIPEGMPVDRYETVLVYEKEGVQKEFTLESPEAPWNDSTWTWIETQNKLVEKGYTPPIHDFSLTTLDGFDITQDVLDDPDYSFLIVMYDVTTVDSDELKSVSELVEKGKENGYKAYGMTSSGEGELTEFLGNNNLPFDMHITDEITLKTMVRSNPGVLLLKDGMILDKWPGSKLPGDNLYKPNGLSSSVSELHKNRNLWATLTLVLLFASMAILVTSFRLLYDGWNGKD